MAEINVERKGPSVWPWVVGLLVIALLAWALIEMFGRDQRSGQPAATDTVGVPAQPGAPAPGTGQ